jgi:type II secretory ATPase GspE/PulE/Tfp pilus assembly ATPase PilB-like protein
VWTENGRSQQFILPNTAKTILARIRVLARLIPGKFSRFQESHFEVTLDCVNWQFRLSEIAPISRGNMVLRVICENHSTRTIDTLGMPENMLNPLKELLLNPFGLLLASGQSAAEKHNFVQFFALSYDRIQKS